MQHTMGPEKKDKGLNIRLKLSLYEALEQRAEQAGLTISAYVRRLIQQDLDQPRQDLDTFKQDVHARLEALQREMEQRIATALEAVLLARPSPAQKAGGGAPGEGGALPSKRAKYRSAAG